MARPCGCGNGGGGVYVGVDGIVVSGTGTAQDPGRIGLANPITGSGCEAIMSCVSSRLGVGLKYDPINGRMQVALSSDGGNSLIFGTDNGLYTAGGGGGGGDSAATVDGLVAYSNPIIGGSYGAGYSQFPEGQLRPYQIAMDMDLRLIHVPVRRSRELFVVAQHYRDLGNYNTAYAGVTTNSIDLQYAERVMYLPGGAPSGNAWDPTYAAKAGYFGYNTRHGVGMPLISDLLSAVQRRTVLYMEVKDLGLSVSDTLDPINTFTTLKAVIQRYGAQKSVIIGAEYPTAASAPDKAQIRAGLINVRDAGMAIALHITTLAMMDANTPASLVADGFTWVFVHYSLADQQAVKVKAYKTAGLNVMIFGAHRQYHYTLMTDTVRFGAGGLKGLLSYDPVYCAGITSTYRYRTATATWGVTTPDYGRHSNWSGSIDGQRDRYRGYIQVGDANRLSIDGDVLLPSDTDPSFRPSGYYILQGEQCPLPYNAVTSKYDSYDIDVSFRWDSLISDDGRWMSVWFGNPEDRGLTDWTQATEFTRGYNFQLSQEGIFILQRYDGIASDGVTIPAYQYALDWNSPWFGTIAANTEYRVKVRVRPDRIIVGPASQVEGNTHTRTFNAGTGQGERWRGAYFYLGRHFFNSVDQTRCRFVNLVVTTI